MTGIMCAIAGASSSEPLSGEFVTSVSTGSTSIGPSYTFSNVNIGAAATTRTVVVGISWNAGAGNRLINSISIGGVAATLIQTSTASAAWERCALAYAIVPTGTTASVAITWNGTVTYGAVLGVYRFVGVKNVSAGVFDVHDNGTTTYSTPVSANVGDYIVSSLGVGFGVANWTNTTERYSYTHNNDYLEGAMIQSTTSGTRTISATGSSYGVLSTIVIS